MMRSSRWLLRRDFATKAAAERALQKNRQQKLCPFAAPLLQHDDKLLRIVASTAQTPQQAIEDVRDEVKKLVGKDRSETHETTLIVLNDSREHSFVYHFRDFVRLSWSLQDEAIGDDYRDLVQLVLFHPAAKHQTYAEQEEEHAGDYTIRSPYPTLHLLRQEDVLKAVQSGYPDLEYLPSRNQAKLNRLGLDVCRQRWRECFEVDDH